MSLGQKIKAIRLEREETLEVFGKKFEPIANRGLVSRWENNFIVPNPDRIKKIAELGNLTVEELLKDDNPLASFSDLELINELQRRAAARNENTRSKD